jgi:hypothetical protein
MMASYFAETRSQAELFRTRQTVLVRGRHDFCVAAFGGGADY